MANWYTTYWRVFNILVRAFGLVTLVAGTGFIIWGAARIVVFGAIPVLASPLWVLPLVGLLAAALGIAILRGPTYRPDLGDVFWQFDPYGTKTQQLFPAGRAWWTGDDLR